MSRKSGDVKGLSWPGWQRHRPIQADKICIDNLQISTDVFLDPFGRTKSQPALLSVTLFLRQQFQSAAKKDALDQSTVHYGSLSKNIRETIERKAGTDELRTVRQMWNLIIDMLLDETVVDAFEIDIFFPKACLTGDGIGFRKSMSRNGPGSFIIYFKNLRVSTLIGVNSHEREYKQPVIANVWLDDAEEEILVSTQLYVWQAQQSIVEAIEGSSFETLESLSTAVADKVLKRLNVENKLQVAISVKISKPLAIPFADAPSVEIYRPLDFYD